MLLKRTLPILCLLWACTSVRGEDAAGAPSSPPPAPSSPTLAAKDKLIVETLLRLKSFDLESSPPAKEALLRYLRSAPGTDTYFRLLERFAPAEMVDDLLEFSLAHCEQTSGVRAAKILISMERQSRLRAEVDGPYLDRSVAAVTLLGHAGAEPTVPILLAIITSEKYPREVRTAAVAGIGRRREGQTALLNLVVQGQLAEELKFAAANVLLSSDQPALQQQAAKYLELPATADNQPLPALSLLVERRGDVSAGAIVFRTLGTCSHCHKVHGEGKEVGPDLSEIGSKLSREAMYVSILDPSAAVSHNFETYTLLTDDGSVINGLLVSDSEDAVTLRTADGIDHTAVKDKIEWLKKQPKSLMPQDLQRLMTVEQLVNLVEYTMTLKKP